MSYYTTIQTIIGEPDIIRNRKDNQVLDAVSEWFSKFSTTLYDVVDKIIRAQNSATFDVLHRIFISGFLKRLFNIKLLGEVLKLEDDWNGNGASKFDPKLISFCEKLLYELTEQPDLFPTARDSIQLEYRDQNNENKYLEFEIFLDKIKEFKIDENKKAESHLIDINDINQEIANFYA